MKERRRKRTMEKKRKTMTTVETQRWQLQKENKENKKGYLSRRKGRKRKSLQNPKKRLSSQLRKATKYQMWRKRIRSSITNN